MASQKISGNRQSVAITFRRTRLAIPTGGDPIPPVAAAEPQRGCDRTEGPPAVSRSCACCAVDRSLAGSAAATGFSADRQVAPGFGFCF